jgi:hypothetical protein
MADIAEQLIEQEMFGDDDEYYKVGGYKCYHKTPAERKIASIRQEIWINMQNGMTVQDARRDANIKYGHGWRERGLVSNSDNQWTEEELKPFIKQKGAKQ